MPDIVMPPNARAYSLEDLINGYDAKKSDSILDTYWFKQYRAFYPLLRPHGKDRARRAAAAQHDALITEALFDYLDTMNPRKPIVGFMGGHSIARDHNAYRDVAKLAYAVTRAEFLVVSGGGPGIMEAVHVGAWFAGCSEAVLETALDDLAAAGTAKLPTIPRDLLDDKGDVNPGMRGAPFLDELRNWYEKADSVRRSCPEIPGASLAVPSWKFGDEPVMPFATHYAAFFENSIREETLVREPRAGIVYARGGGGTLREIFQDVEENYYPETPDAFTPMVFFDRDSFWSPIQATPGTIKLDDAIGRAFTKAFADKNVPWSDRVVYTTVHQTILALLASRRSFSEKTTLRLLGAPMP